VLDQAVIASVNNKVKASKRKSFSCTSLSACPRATYINWKGLNPRKPGSSLVLEDGHHQEAVMLSRLKEAGFTLEFVGDDQLTVYSGQAKIPGHPDGFISSYDMDRHMLELKAMNNRRFKFFQEVGLEASIKAQVQIYLSSRPLGVEACWVYATRKETALPACRLEERNEEFSREITGRSDEIILGGWEPKAVRSEYCVVCRHSEFCWGQQRLVDFSDATRIESQQELVEAWYIGKMKKDAGKELHDQAKKELGDLLRPEEDNWIACGTVGSQTYGVEVSRIKATKHKFSRQAFVQHFGADRLHLVMKEETSSYIKTREVNLDL